jgi:hypothetical protein
MKKLIQTITVEKIIGNEPEAPFVRYLNKALNVMKRRDACFSNAAHGWFGNAKQLRHLCAAAKIRNHICNWGVRFFRHVQVLVFLKVHVKGNFVLRKLNYQAADWNL